MRTNIWGRSNQHDCWLGGVHLSDETLWRWDPTRKP